MQIIYIFQVTVEGSHIKQDHFIFFPTLIDQLDCFFFYLFQSWWSVVNFLFNDLKMSVCLCCAKRFCPTLNNYNSVRLCRLQNTCHIPLSEFTRHSWISHSNRGQEMVTDGGELQFFL